MKHSMRGKSKDELTKALADSEKAFSAFRFSLSGGKTGNVREGRALRLKIARIKTELKAAHA